MGSLPDDQCRACGHRTPNIARYKDKVCGNCCIEFDGWIREVHGRAPAWKNIDLDFSDAKTAVAFDEWMSTRPTPV